MSQQNENNLQWKNWLKKNMDLVSKETTTLPNRYKKPVWNSFKKNTKQNIEWLPRDLFTRRWLYRKKTHWRQRKDFFKRTLVKSRRAPKPWFWKPWKYGFFWRKRNRSWRKQNPNRRWVFYMRLKNSLDCLKRPNTRSFFNDDEERVRFRLKHFYKFNLKFHKAIKQIYGHWTKKELKKFFYVNVIPQHKYYTYNCGGF